MSAKDYRICPAIFNAYIAKTSKKDKNLMTDDRREISEGEIMSLIDWWLYNKCGDDGKGMMFESDLRNDCNVVLRFIHKEVDLKKEFDVYTKDILACDVQSAPFTHLYNCAKYFFELGFNAQKGGGE